ncbi:MAG: UDP-N-acetylmuramoyl-tripeptide--D-alanyl-D-alanine ligase [Polyangiaceae bacterium]|nr:UDP-N-acetylmuramoyl-tripeptide--D-alanyl-D-alanine ligase [Polyangiaceae bacterium]
MATPIPVNHAAFALREILSATGAVVVGGLGDEAPAVSGVSTDTRTLEAGQAFVALAGEHHDGHARLVEARDRGARVALVERAVPALAGLVTLRVGSTQDALGALGRAHLERWRAARPERRVVCITGSAGKTTTKLATAALLGGVLAARAPGAESADAVACPAGNLNNRVGVPMSLLTLGPAHRFAVLELGTSRPGEIPTLTRMCTPDVAVLTLVAAAHSEHLGGVETIAREKAAIFAFAAPGATGVANADDERAAHALAAAPLARRLGYGSAAQASYRLVDRRLELRAAALRARVELRRPDGSTLALATPLLGRAGALATAAALAVGETLLGPIAAAEAEGALESLGSLGRGGRFDLCVRADGLWLLDDSYNANPASCQSSLESAAEVAALTGRPLVLVLGEMRELGAESDGAHTELGVRAAASGARLLVAVGGEAAERMARAAASGGLTTLLAKDAREAGALALAAVAPRDLVLVKGSRGVRTELAVQALLATVPAHGSARPGRAASAPREEGA